MNVRSSSPRRRLTHRAFRLRGRLLLAGLLSTGFAAAEGSTKQRCVESHVLAQSQRLEGRLVESQQSLQVCAHESCPEIVQRDCVRWLEESRSEVPTVVFEASERGRALRDVTVTQADRVLAESIDGTAVALDPGSYDFVFTTADGRRQTLEVLIRQGDHNRAIAVDFAAPETVDATWVLRVPPSARVSGGITLAATALSAGLGASALLGQANALGDCAPSCSERRSRGIATRAALADVSGGVALAAGVVTFVLVARASGRERAPTREGLRPLVALSPQAGWVALGGHF